MVANSTKRPDRIKYFNEICKYTVLKSRMTTSHQDITVSIIFNLKNIYGAIFIHHMHCNICHNLEYLSRSYKIISNNKYLYSIL